jgi:hypothetical protein
MLFWRCAVWMFLSTRLPEQHLSAESKNIVNLGMGLIGTMTALVLGLLVASAKSYYDTQSTELTGMSADIVLLDRVLAHYGPETQEVRDLLHGAVARPLELLWPQDSQRDPQMTPTAAGGEIILIKFRSYHPRTTLNTRSKPRPQTWRLILEKRVGSCSNRAAVPFPRPCWRCWFSGLRLFSPVLAYSRLGMPPS